MEEVMEEVIICFMIFYVGSLMGCLLEEIWCMLTKHKFEIRGSMVYEPLIPIYGLAALLITLIANRVGYNLWKVFILGSIVSALIEYLSSYFQEKIFHTKAWDYSNYPLNLNGRINLPYTLGFGFFAVLFIKQLKLMADFVINHFNLDILYMVNILLLIVFIMESIISVMALYRQKKRREGYKAKNKLEVFLDERYSDKRLNRIYNNSVYVGKKKHKFLLKHRL